MKKILLLQIIAFLALSSFSQTQSNAHLTFKGVPIDGTLKEFVTKMKQNGFTLSYTEDGYAMLKGDFAAYQDCKVKVSTLNQKDLVSAIEVSFPKYEDWSSLSAIYFSLKGMLTEKYGKPSVCVEKFEPYEPNNDGSRMTAVNLDRCKYFTTYLTDIGKIELSIKSTSSSGYVLLKYRDKINGDIIKSKAMEDL